jgi:hypothetical protein
LEKDQKRGVRSPKPIKRKLKQSGKSQELALKILSQLTKEKLGNNRGQNPTQKISQTPSQAGSITQCGNE